LLLLTLLTPNLDLAWPSGCLALAFNMLSSNISLKDREEETSVNANVKK